MKVFRTSLFKESESISPSDKRIYSSFLDDLEGKEAYLEDGDSLYTIETESSLYYPIYPDWLEEVLL